MSTFYRDTSRFFIGGTWVEPSSSKVFRIVNPSTEEMIASVPEGQESDMGRAVAAARKAFYGSGWRDLPASGRADALRRFAEALQRRKTELTQTVSRQNGMPSWLSAMFEGDVALGLLAYYAEVAEQQLSSETRPSQLGRHTLVERTPVGVVAAIVPWNYPVTLAMTKIAPALVAGCTMVVKTSPGTVLDSYILAEAAMEAELPAGVINWVAADREVGRFLVTHPGIDKVAFTGSTAAGRAIARDCGELLRPVTLELGGKSASIVLEDADVERFAQNLPMVSFLNNGQTCFASTRILAPRSRYAEIVDTVASVASQLTVGDALDPTTQIGPMVSADHRDRVERYIATGRAEARLVCGGGRPRHKSRGWFVEPTVFADADNRSVIAQEEIFGPVLTIIPYDGEDEAVCISNDSEFGLGGTVWSSDEGHALDIAARIQTGTIGINGYAPAVGSPFGGVKASGIGRELGPEALNAFSHLKSTYVM